MNAEKKGRIVWHDLFTPDRPVSMAFYERVTGWTFVTEHADDFAWGGGEKDFVLAFLGDEAGAGIAEIPKGQRDGWIPYVEVADVNATAERGERLGGTIVRPPFDVPGVGRNCLLRDPLGALVGVSISRHGFPAPERQFGDEVYWSNRAAFPDGFYADLFGWQVSPRENDLAGQSVRQESGARVAVVIGADAAAASDGAWLPGIRTTDLDAAIGRAQALAGVVVGNAMESSGGPSFVTLRDPNGALFALQGPTAESVSAL